MSVAGTRPARYVLPRAARITDARDFKRVYARGSRARGRWIVVVGLARRQGGHRVGLSVAKEHGAAVRRNKIKRLLREAFRLERPTLPGAFDLVLIPVKNPAKLLLAELRAELVALVTKLMDQAGRGARPAPRRRP